MSQSYKKVYYFNIITKVHSTLKQIPRLGGGSPDTISYLKSSILNKNISPDGAVNYRIFNKKSIIPAHNDLPIKHFNCLELKCLIEYQYESM